MTPTKHTPGPWYWTHSPKTNQAIAVATLEGPNVLCRYWSDEQEPSDAKLIAAAPELLEVLENLLAVDNPDTLITANWSAEDWKNAKRQYNEAIKSAIQKATQ